jgi:hypothetical protein
MNWISLKERKPKMDELVFVLLRNTVPDVLRFIGDSFVTLDGLEEEEVSHWMPIPILKR